MAEPVWKGRISYGPRAFSQDAELAMGGNIVRALIELITNADDAYGDEENKGKITVAVEHRRTKSWRVVVRNRATGMSGAEMVEKLGSAGERTSGFESGKSLRGHLGRGAKDTAAFGPVTFESPSQKLARSP